MIEPKLRFKADDGSQFPDWEEKTIDEVAECLDNKRVPVNSEERKKRVGIIPYYGAGGIQGYIDDYLFDEELVLLLEDGDAFDDFQTKSIAQYITGKSWVNNHAHVLRANGNSYFLFASLEHKDIRRWTQLAGASRKKLLKDSMLKITVNIPSLPEQQKIADFLSTIDTVIEKQKETASAWEERKKGAMQKLFSQKVRFKADDGDQFPEWEEKKLGEVFEFYNGKAHENVISENGKYVVVNSKFISTDGTVRKYTNEMIFPLIKKDIVMVMSDVPNGKAISKCFLINENNKYTLNQRICCLRTKENAVFYINQISRNKYFLKFDDGVKQTNLRKNDILQCPLLCPCLAEQQKIADCLSSLDEVIKKQKATLAVWEELKKGLLQQMFV